MRCHGTTVTGKHCKLQALPGQEYCQKHMHSTIVTSVVCRAQNRDGHRCKHRTTRSDLCWQHLLKEKKLRIKKSPIAGLGLFTTVPIARGVNVAPYTGNIVVSHDPNFGGDHVLQIRRRPPTYIDARRSNTGEGRFANSNIGGRNNGKLIFNTRSQKAYVQAASSIAAGSEITVPYGAAYWRAVRARS